MKAGFSYSEYCLRRGHVKQGRDMRHVNNVLTEFLFKQDGFGGLVVSMLASGTRVRGFKPGQSRWIFRASEKSSAYLPSEGKWKNLSHVPALRHVKEPVNYDVLAKFPPSLAEVSRAYVVRGASEWGELIGARVHSAYRLQCRQAPHASFVFKQADMPSQVYQLSVKSGEWKPIWRELVTSARAVSTYLISMVLVINLLAPELFFLILAHPVYKMWIIQEPNTLELWNKLHFEEERYGECIPCLKYSVPIFVE